MQVILSVSQRWWNEELLAFGVRHLVRLSASLVSCGCRKEVNGFGFINTTNMVQHRVIKKRIITEYMYFFIFLISLF